MKSPSFRAYLDEGLFESLGALLTQLYEFGLTLIVYIFFICTDLFSRDPKVLKKLGRLRLTVLHIILSVESMDKRLHAADICIQEGRCNMK